MEVAEVCMTAKDIFVLLGVCENLNETTFDDLNIISIIDSLESLHVIDSEKHHRLLQFYKEFRRTSTRCEISKKQDFYLLLEIVRGCVPFFGFRDAVENAGYTRISRELTLGRDKYGTAIYHGVLKRELPNAKIIHRLYAELKRRADNNLFETQTSLALRRMTTALRKKIKKIILCSDINRLQLLVDARCVLYFLLCQQCPSVHDRNEVLKEMRDSMPRDVDRTVFDTIFHSYMAFNRAVSGNVETAEKHAVQARIVCSSCVPGFIYIVMTLWSQYKNNILYVRSNCSEKLYFNGAKASYSEIQECLEDVRDEVEINIWKTISTLDIARSTVGIHQKLEVCDISTINTENIEYASKMLDLVPVPRDIRRRMYYFVIHGRIFEKSDRSKAKQYVEKAVKLAGDGCYDETEKNNIERYLKSLESGELPCPSL